MKRPLGWVIICLALGILLGDVVSLPVGIWLATGLLLASITLFSARWRRHLLPGLLVIAGAANIALNEQVLSPLDLRLLLDGKPRLITIQGWVERVDLRASTARGGKNSLRTSARLRVERVRIKHQSWQPAHGWVLATARVGESAPVHAGQHVRIFGVCESPPGAFADGMFDYRRHLAQRGIFHELVFEGAADVEHLDGAPIPLTDRFRTWATATLQRGLPKDDPAVGLLWAITVGQRTSLTDDVAEPFMRSGTMHLFAISGLHIGLIAGIMVALLRLVRVPREGVSWIAIPCLWFFTAVTGWQPSAVRATIMMSVVVIGWSLRRPADLLNSLSAAAFLILLWDPRELFHAGFQLSFAVVASIAVLLPPLERLRQRLMKSDPLLPAELRPRWQQLLDGPARFVTMSIAVSIAAWAGSLPLIMLYFHLITPVSLIANVIIVQLGALALASALGSLLCAPFIPLFTDLFNHSAWFFAHAMLAGSRWFSELPMASFNARTPPLATMIAYYSVLWLIASGWLLRWRRVCVPLGVVLVLGGVLAWESKYSSPRLTVLPLEGGHALFLDDPGSENWLIDCGDNANWRFRVRPFLQAQGVNHLDNLVLTHGDVRHVGAATNAVAEFDPRRIVLNPLPQRSTAFRSFEQIISTQQVAVIRPTAGEILGPWTVLHPDSDDDAHRADTTSLVMRLDLGGVTVLHLPDLDRDGLRELQKRHPNLCADVVMASPAKDGRFEPAALAQLFKPSLFVAIDSEFPASDQLSPAASQRLDELGMPSLRTSRDGAIELGWQDDGLIVHSASGRTEPIDLDDR